MLYYITLNHIIDHYIPHVTLVYIALYIYIIILHSARLVFGQLYVYIYINIYW
jgi:hypothetical protein